MADNQVRIAISTDGAQAESGFNSVSQAARGFKGQISELNGVTSTLTALLGAGGLVAAINDTIQAAAQMERAAIGIAVTARYSGAGMQEALTAAKSLAKDGLMSVVEASQSLQNLLGRGFTLEQSIAMMNRLKDSASFNRQAHLEFGQSIVGATEGLKNENSVLVDNAGVTKNVSQMWKEYAQEHGKSVDKLTQSEKRTAEYNGILKETEGQMGNAARMSNTFQGAQARLNTELQNTRAMMGQRFIPVMTELLKAAQPVLTVFTHLVLATESFGVQIAGSVHQLKLLGDLLSGGINLKDFLVQSTQIRLNMAEQIADNKRRMDAGPMVLPDLGPDTGKRRSDAKQAPDKPKAWRDARTGMVVTEGGFSEAGPWGQIIRNTDTTIPEMSAASRINWNDPQSQWNSAGLLSITQQGMLDANISTRQEQNRNAEALTAEREYLATRDALRGEYRNMDLLRLDEEMAGWEQSWAMKTDKMEVYEQRMFQIEQTYSAEKTKLAERESLQKVQWASNALSNISTVTDAFYRLSGSKSRGMFKVSQGIAGASALVSTYLAAQLAYENEMDKKSGGSGNQYAAAAASAAAVAQGLVKVAMIYSAQPGDRGGGATGSYAGVSSGSGNSPVVTQPYSSASQQAEPSITINVHGNVIGEERWVESNLIPTIRELVQRRNVDIGLVPTDT